MSTIFKILLYLCMFFSNSSQAAYWWDTEVPDYLQASQIKQSNVIKDIPYGSDIRQKFDVYIPYHKVTNAPVIFLVHGGAWMSGDKASARMVVNKVNYWGEKGFIVISTNYRLAPYVSISNQIKDVVQAINRAQALAHEWGADKKKFILMGHSSGGHLISTITPADVLFNPAAFIAIDAAGFDIPAIMSKKHQKFYDIAFYNPKEWLDVSPQSKASPFNFLLFCSNQSRVWCEQGNNFSKAVIKNKGTAEQIIVNLNHNDINEKLGNPSFTHTKFLDAYLIKLKILN